MYIHTYLDKLLDQYIFHQAQLGHLGRNSLQHIHWDNLKHQDYHKFGRTVNRIVDMSFLVDTLNVNKKIFQLSINDLCILTSYIPQLRYDHTCSCTHSRVCSYATLIKLLPNTITAVTVVVHTAINKGGDIDHLITNAKLLGH